MVSQLDLAVANGHVDDFTEQGIPYRMRPQFFHNAGRGVFQETPPTNLGPYFSRPCLGRALATLDADRDGRPDLIVTHLDEPAALLMNSTHLAGCSLSLSLIGVTSARDAIGATVTVTIAGRNIVRQLTAGDGYLASNERKLVIGVGATDMIDELSLRWPSGITTTFHEVPSNREVIVVEGNSQLIVRPVSHR
jgi:hypothetical protein